MKFIKISLFFLILSFSAFANDSTAVFKRWSIGINGSPDYCYRRLVMKSSNNATYKLANYKNSTEIPIYSYTGGLSAAYSLNNYFSIGLGAEYSQKGFQTKSMNVVNPTLPDVVLGQGTFRYDFKYLQLPLKVNFVYGKKKIRLLASAGLTSSFLLYEQTTTKIDYYNVSGTRESARYDYETNPFNLFLTGGVGADIKLGKKMGFIFEPTYSYGLFRTMDGSIAEFLWSVGLNLGCYIKL